MNSFSKKISDWKILHPNVFPNCIKDAARLWFRMSSRWRAYPNFIIIGAPKCGTTSLFAYLSQHPKVIPSMAKETTYLRDVYFKSLSDYRSCFPFRMTLGRNESITGEGTTTYFYDKNVVGRINLLPSKPKLFLMLRDPSDRAISQYYHFHQRNDEQMEMHEAFDYLFECYSDWKLGEPLPHVDYSIVKSDYLRYGIYAHFFPMWAPYFEQGRLRIYEFAELIRETNSVLDDACEFLSIESMEVEARVFNAGLSRSKDEELLEKLAEFYAPLNTRFFELINADYKWRQKK
jgi:hypothetical protein